MSVITSTGDYISYTLVGEMLFGQERPIRGLVIGNLTAVIWEPKFLKESSPFDFNWFNSHFGLHTVSSSLLKEAFEVLDRPVKLVGFGRFTLLRFGPKNS